MSELVVRLKSDCHGEPTGVQCGIHRDPLTPIDEVTWWDLDEPVVLEEDVRVVRLGFADLVQLARNEDVASTVEAVENQQEKLLVCVVDSGQLKVVLVDAPGQDQDVDVELLDSFAFCEDEFMEAGLDAALDSEFDVQAVLALHRALTKVAKEAAAAPAAALPLLAARGTTVVSLVLPGNPDVYIGELLGACM
jgi:hypothetical protein